mmetsp:Transcript_1181/g.3470  ORF Transcript_1181/g.3470 Transcript_1181/m.3470 type:complete len:200 (+) Transcript_1181:433-1032(+)
MVHVCPIERFRFEIVRPEYVWRVRSVSFVFNFMFFPEIFPSRRNHGCVWVQKYHRIIETLLILPRIMSKHSIPVPRASKRHALRNLNRKYSAITTILPCLVHIDLYRRFRQRIVLFLVFIEIEHQLHLLRVRRAHRKVERFSSHERDAKRLRHANIIFDFNIAQRAHDSIGAHPSLFVCQKMTMRVVIDLLLLFLFLSS